MAEQVAAVRLSRVIVVTAIHHAVHMVRPTRENVASTTEDAMRAVVSTMQSRNALGGSNNNSSFPCTTPPISAAAVQVSLSTTQVSSSTPSAAISAIKGQEAACVRCGIYQVVSEIWLTKDTGFYCSISSSLCKIAPDVILFTARVYAQYFSPLMRVLAI